VLCSGEWAVASIDVWSEAKSYPHAFTGEITVCLFFSLLHSPLTIRRWSLPARHWSPATRR
jgi:hypothetical protein